MSYIPTNWKNGDVVTSEKLNKLEQGVANTGGVLIVNGQSDLETQTITLDKTWQEIYEAGFPIVKIIPPQGSPYLAASWLVIVTAAAPTIAGGSYILNVYNSGEVIQFSTDSSNGYPSAVMNEGSGEGGTK